MKPILNSRKFWIAIVAMVLVTVVVVVCILRKVSPEAMITIAGTIGALAFKLIGAIALEDAAGKTQPMAQAGTIYNTLPPPPPPSGIQTPSSPPPTHRHIIRDPQARITPPEGIPRIAPAQPPVEFLK